MQLKDLNLTKEQETLLVTIATIRSGQLLDLFASAVQECVIIAQTQKKKTKAILSLEIETKQDDLLLTGEVDKKIPQKKQVSEYLYSDQQGLLFRNDPRQESMFGGTAVAVLHSKNQDADAA